MKLGVYTAVCEEDRGWIDQYLAELERLALPFAVHLDRCSRETSKRLRQHRLCFGATQHHGKEEFNERHKQGVFDLVVGGGFDWAIAVDVDETFEKDAPAMLATLACDTADYLQTMWLNLWGDREHIRIDGPFEFPLRVKLYRLNSGIRWFFDHPITNGLKQRPGCREPVKGIFPLRCLHWGMMTLELRRQHKERWDRIYTAAVGGNPYKFWDYALDEATHPPVVARHDYL